MAVVVVGVVVYDTSACARASAETPAVMRRSHGLGVAWVSATLACMDALALYSNPLFKRVPPNALTQLLFSL